MKRLTLLAISLIGLIAPFLMSQTVFAHAYDEFEVSTYISLADDAIHIEVELESGYLIGPDVVTMIDTNGDQTLSEEEVLDYAYEVMSSLKLEANSVDIPLELVTFEYPSYSSFAEGMHGIILNITASLPETVPGDYALYFENTYAIEGVTNEYYVNGFVDTDAKGYFDIIDQSRDWDQQTISIAYSILTPLETSSTPSLVEQWLPRIAQAFVIASQYIPLS